VALVVFALWWFLLRSTAPPAVSLDEAVDAATSTTVAGQSTVTTAPATAASVEGSWTAGGDSFVGYRVNEELANIGFKTAAARTSDLAADLVIDGDTVTTVTIEANMLSLESDSSRRDGAIKRQALETEAG